MTILAKIFAGFFAGLSVGVYCLGLCLPIFLPLLLSQNRRGRKSLFLVAEFSLGRLLGYLFFGLLFGWFGMVVKSSFVHAIAGLANLWIGILIIIYSLGLIDRKFCAALPFEKIKWPLLLGFLTGVNICPPFLGSLAYIFNLKSALLSLGYFLLFFLGTSVYIVPFTLLGAFSGNNWLQKGARISGIFVGIYFVVINLIRIW